MPYCLDESDDDIYLEGTNNDYLLERPTSYLDIRVDICNEYSRNPGDPECSS